jgi:hypothetical protein
VVTLAALAQIIFFLEMLKFPPLLTQRKFKKKKKIVKENEEHPKYHLSKILR